MFVVALWWMAQAYPPYESWWSLFVLRSAALATFFNARYTPQERGRDWNDEWFMGDILRVTR